MPHVLQGKAGADTGLVSLAIVARLLGVPVDTQQLAHACGISQRHCADRDLIRAVQHLGLKAKAIDSHWSRLAKTPLPAIAVHPDGRYYLIAKLEGEKALIHDPLEP